MSSILGRGRICNPTSCSFIACTTVLPISHNWPTSPQPSLYRSRKGHNPKHPFVAVRAHGYIFTGFVWSWTSYLHLSYSPAGDSYDTYLTYSQSHAPGSHFCLCLRDYDLSCVSCVYNSTWLTRNIICGILGFRYVDKMYKCYLKDLGRCSDEKRKALFEGPEPFRNEWLWGSVGEALE
jgi:hypothetical protein